MLNEIRSLLDEVEKNERCEISRDLFYYFMDIVPPLWMYKDVVLTDGTTVFADYGFVEGKDIPVTAFWKDGEHYYAQRTASNKE